MVASRHLTGAFLLLFPFCDLPAASIWRRPEPVDAPVIRPAARVQTTLVPQKGDSADDPAIWIHPASPERSLVLGTDKQGALFVYNLDGTIRQVVSDGCKPNNVDVLYGFRLGTNIVDLALAGVRRKGALGFKVWAIDALSGHLSDVTEGGIIPVFAGTEPYGSCTYHSRKSGQSYFFINNKHGQVEQYILTPAVAAGKVSARKIREFRVGSTTEGCVADDELAVFYLAEENVGIWKFSAEPDGSRDGRLIARVGEHGLKADVEGLTIYYASSGRGYLIASSQGNNTFKVYDRREGNRFCLTIDPKDGPIDDVSDTDGICVASSPTSPLFPKGIFIVQDGKASGRRQNFKFYGWEDIAGTNLMIDTTWSPR